MLTILVAALTAATVALAMPAVKVGTLFAGKTAHKRYSISVSAKCSVKKCSKTDEVLITVTAGSRNNPSAACQFAGYGLPLTKVSADKFSGKLTVVEPMGPISFRVTGKFTSATKVTGTVVGSKSCGGTDAFKLTGKIVGAPTGATH